MRRRKPDFLFTPEGREFLRVEYLVKERSTHELAEQLGGTYYPNKILRALRYYGFRVRDNSKSQAACLRRGRKLPPNPKKGTNEENPDRGDG